MREFGQIVWVSEETERARRLVCDGCEYFNNEADLCMLCGCNVSNKILLPQTSCPLQKWKEEEILKTPQI